MLDPSRFRAYKDNYAPMSNPKIKYTKRIKDGDNIRRIFEVIGKDSQATVELEPDEIVDFRLFKRKMASVGDYLFTWNQKEFSEQMTTLLDSKHDEIEIIKTLGRIKKDTFALSNVLIRQGNEIDLLNKAEIDGKVYELDKPLHGMFVHSSDKDYTTTLLEYTKLLNNSLNHNDQGLVALAWLRASLYATEIIKYFNFFPFLLVVGEKQSGKSFFCKTLMKVIGMETDGDGLPSSTAVGVLRKSTKLIDLPYWLDEYSDDRKSGKKIEGLLRSAYNRSSFVKADLGSATEVTSQTCTATFILSGESMSSDPATRERCVILMLDKGMKDLDARNKITNMRDDLSVIGTHWLKEKTRNDIDVKEYIEERLKQLTQQYGQKDLRSLTTYAILGCFLDLTLDDMGSELSADDVIATFLKKDGGFKEEANHVTEFWEDFINLVKIGELINGQNYYLANTDTLHLHFPSVMSTIMQLRRREGIESRIEKHTLKSYLNGVAGVARPIVAGISSQAFRSLQFDLSVLPDEVQEQFSLTSYLDEDDNTKLE